MKKNAPWLLLAFTLLFGACAKDELKQSFVYYRPVYKTKLEVRNEIKSGAIREIANAGKLFYKDGYVFLNDLERGVHVIDISQPTAPQKVAFIAIPGCVDLAVRGNTLYADLTTDLVAIDISNPKQVKLTAVLEGVFPHRYYNQFQADTSRIIIDWVRVDTTTTSSEIFNWGLKASEVNMIQNFASTDSRGSTTANGVGGSMARFALSADRMYTVSHNDLKVFNTSNAPIPSFVKEMALAAWDIETIFPYEKNLFVGSQTGMYIFDIANKDNPVELSKFVHARVCDPVVADGQYAYVTLRNGNRCGGFTNQLDVLDISNLKSPSLIKSYPLTNPHGLSVDGGLLLICDGADGLRILNATNKNNVQQLGQIKGMDAYDVIAFNGLAIVSASDGLYLIDYKQPNTPIVASSIRFAK